MSTAPRSIMGWFGDEGRALAVYGPCPCGCSPDWYLSANDAEGHGFTYTFADEAEARAFARESGCRVIRG